MVLVWGDDNGSIFIRHRVIFVIQERCLGESGDGQERED